MPDCVVKGGYVCRRVLDHLGGVRLVAASQRTATQDEMSAQLPVEARYEVHMLRMVSQSPNSIEKRRGFTLIEILVVIVVIAVLATLVAPNVFQHVGAAKDATARSQIEMLGAALDAYRLDNGRYPTTSQGLPALWQEPAIEPRPRNWRGPYLRKEVPLDPWQHPYVFTSPGEVNPTGYDLMSYGLDGQQGGEDEAADILSWK